MGEHHRVFFEITNIVSNTQVEYKTIDVLSWAFFGERTISQISCCLSTQCCGAVILQSVCALINWLKKRDNSFWISQWDF